jgi:ABC-type transport system involved in multi-copper enzyme maturation permease subunit
LRLAAVVKNTFRQAVRDRVLYVLFFFGVLTIGSGALLGPLSLGEAPKISKDLALASISVFGVLIAILIGTRLVYEEMEKKTIYLIVPKPIKRWQFLLGKYLGLMSVLALILIAMTVVFAIYVFLSEGEFEARLLEAVLLTYFELAVVTAVAILFSTFATPVGSGVFAFAVFFVGHVTRDLRALGEISESAAVKLSMNFIYYLLPNLSNFNIRGEVVHNVPVPLSQLMYAMAYGLIYAVIVIVLSVLAFQRRDF